MKTQILLAALVTAVALPAFAGGGRLKAMDLNGDGKVTASAWSGERQNRPASGKAAKCCSQAQSARRTPIPMRTGIGCVSALISKACSTRIEPSFAAVSAA